MPVFPVCTALEFASELSRRLALWAPAVLCATSTVEDFAGFLHVLCLAAARDKYAWLRFAQNAWATRGRFMHAYNQCLVCGSHSDRLMHIVVCRPFWRPIFIVLGVAGGRCTLRQIILSEFSARRIGLGFRSHAALRGCPVSSAVAWASPLRASA